MKSLKDYKEIFRKISENKGLKGETVDLIIDLLANATWISDIEGAIYMREASLEKSVGVNSKIQHAMDNMYSVFRGVCPKVIFKFNPTKFFDLGKETELYTSAGFKIFYYGYVNDSGDIIQAPISIPPEQDKTYSIVGIITKGVVDQTFSMEDDKTLYYTTSQTNLSEAPLVWIDDVMLEVTRRFQEHVGNEKIFDLTTTDFGSRLYLPPGHDSTGRKLRVLYFKDTILTDLEIEEVKKVKIKGTKEVEKPTYIRPIDRANMSEVHYKSARERFLGNIIKGNNDIGRLLEETYPDIVDSATHYYNQKTNTLSLFYIPKKEDQKLSKEQIVGFKNNKKAYYVTEDLVVEAGLKREARIGLEVELFSWTNIEEKIKDIIGRWSRKFGIRLEEKIEEMKALISKIPEVRQIKSVSIIYPTEEESDKTNPGLYYDIKVGITTIIKS